MVEAGGSRVCSEVIAVSCGCEWKDGLETRVRDTQTVAGGMRGSKDARRGGRRGMVKGPGVRVKCRGWQNNESTRIVRC